MIIIILPAWALPWLQRLAEIVDESEPVGFFLRWLLGF